LALADGALVEARTHHEAGASVDAGRRLTSVEHRASPHEHSLADAFRELGNERHCIRHRHGNLTHWNAARDQGVDGSTRQGG
jgi:hypothetical protein